MRNHLGIGFGAESVAAFCQPLFQLFPILDDPVVNHGNLAGTVQMGVGVGVGHTAVGRPAGVPQTGKSRLNFAVGKVNPGDPAGFFDPIRAPALSYSPGVVSPVLQPLEGIHQKLGRVLFFSCRNERNNAAHMLSEISNTNKTSKSSNFKDRFD